MSSGAEGTAGAGCVVPPAERFRRDVGHLEAYRWFAPMPDGAFDVCVAGDDELPDPASLAMAAGVLPWVGVMAEEAAAYLAVLVNVTQAGIVGAPQVVSVVCDARGERVTLELNWDGDRYSLWHVTFTWRGAAQRRPCAFGRRDWTTPG